MGLQGVDVVNSQPLTEENARRLLGSSGQAMLEMVRRRGGPSAQVIDTMWPYLKKGDGPWVAELLAKLSRSEHENIMVILNGWADSIRIQAAKDREAAKKALERSRQVLGTVVNRLEVERAINATEAASLRGRAELPKAPSLEGRPAKKLLTSLGAPGVRDAFVQPHLLRQVRDPRA